jgi:carboxyl-terminal processing protease
MTHNFNGWVFRLIFSTFISVVAFTPASAKDPIPFEEMRTFSDVYHVIKRDYVDDTNDQKLFTACAKGMLSSLDDQSELVSAKYLTQIEPKTMAGPGLRLIQKDGLIRAVSPLESSIAHTAGIKDGDILLKINETDVVGKPLQDVTDLLRGDENTTVNLTIIREQETTPRTFSLSRARHAEINIKGKLIRNNIGYLRIAQFNKEILTQLAQELKLQFANSQGPLSGLILDLRDSPGGLLPSAIGIAATFLKTDILITSTDGRAEGSKIRFLANKRYYMTGNNGDHLPGLPAEIKSIPLVVLVNKGTASGAEIVMGALQDHKRATIMGAETFGRSTIQTIIPYNKNNSDYIKITTGRYLTPNGRAAEPNGLKPDISISLKKQSSANPELQKSNANEDDLFIQQALAFLQNPAQK